MPGLLRNVVAVFAGIFIGGSSPAAARRGWASRASSTVPRSEVSAKTGEKIEVRRFARYALGD